MIKAQHSKFAEFVFSHYLRYLFRKHFYSIHLLGAVPKTSSLPLVLLPNHSSWWDGFFVHLLNKQIFKKNIFLMMLEEQLAQNRFFSKIGVYSINPKSVSNLMESLKYTSDLLKTGENRMVVFFPQGELLPWQSRPIEYKRGLDYLRKKCDEFTILQLGIKMEFLNQQRPQVFLKFGKITSSKSENADISLLEKEHANLLEEMETQICNRADSEILFRGKRSVNDWFNDLRTLKSGKRN